MKKILFLTVVITLLLTACGGVDELQAEVDGLQVQLKESQVLSEDLQSELNLAESTIGLCVISLEEATTFSSAAEDALGACLVEVEALSIGPEAGGGGEGEDEVVEDECTGTERILMMSTPVLQQAVNKKGEPRYNTNGKMVMTAIDDSWIEGFSVGDKVCVTKNYGVSGGWSVYLISGTRTADYNLFIPAHYLEPLPTTSSNCHPSYPTVCIPPPPPSLNCGDIPYGNFVVVGSDPHGFDGNNNGVGCE